MRLKPLVCLDLSNFTTFAESLASQGFQVTFQMSSKAGFLWNWPQTLGLKRRGIVGRHRC